METAIHPVESKRRECDLRRVRKIKAVKPAAEIVAEMMAEAQEILRAELAAMSEGD